MGAEEFGFATALPVVAGCIMMRVSYPNIAGGRGDSGSETAQETIGSGEFVVNLLPPNAEVRGAHGRARSGRWTRSGGEQPNRRRSITESQRTRIFQPSVDKCRPRSLSAPPPDESTGSRSRERSTTRSRARERGTYNRRCAIDHRSVKRHRTVGTMLGYQVTLLRQRGITRTTPSSCTSPDRLAGATSALKWHSR